MSDDLDEAETLAMAAAEAVRKRRGAIEAGGDGNLHAITVEILPANHGQVLSVETHLSWKSVIRNATR